VRQDKTFEDVGATSFGGVYESDWVSESSYTSGEFLRATAAIISICLGLALLVHVLIVAPAMQ